MSAPDSPITVIGVVPLLKQRDSRFAVPRRLVGGHDSVRLVDFLRDLAGCDREGGTAAVFQVVAVPTERFKLWEYISEWRRGRAAPLRCAAL